MTLLLIVGLGACDKQSPSSGQADAQASAQTGAATTGEVPGGEVPGGTSDKAKGGKDGFDYRIDRGKAGTPAPDLVFQDPDGRDTTLRAVTGRPMLVNLWATWCAPCVAEMPMLDRIAAEYGPKGLAVLTISQDLQTAPIKGFFKTHDLPNLKSWTDPENRLGFHYATGLLPTSVLYDARGREMVRVVGAMDWSSAEGRALIDAAMAS
ncbi:MAG: TlpA family protein disulfide reductase [Sphingobium sp.]